MKALRLLLIVSVVFLSCQTKEDQRVNEQTLLNIFRAELSLTEQYQGDYIGYMTYQIKNFAKKNKIMTRTINMINEEFDNMSDEEKVDYQLKWQGEFQPMIDKIYQNTWQMIVNQTKDLGQDNMAQIQMLTTKMELLEKETPGVELRPRFFVMPEIKESYEDREKDRD
ncbi:MAG: hypothetical protein HQM16_07155 [Deltaproteobacteria bacterium]|nr:hypothetical protein [Deltaproteobacteria bacterium]